VLPIEGINTNRTRRCTQVLGQRPSLGLAERRQARNIRRRAGIALAEQYRDQGLNMLHEPAQFEDGSVSVEAGLMAMLDRMRTGKLKVFKEHLDLVGGIPPVSPQRWKGAQRGRRFDVRHTLRADDVAPRYNAIVLGQMA
jgi:hypothetical protein